MKLNYLIFWVLATTTATAAFGGLLGENYVKPEFGYLRLSDLGSETSRVDGWAGAFSANYPIMEDAGYGLDIQGNYTYGRLTWRAGE